MEASDWLPEGVDLAQPNAARIYDYLLGGAHNFEIDREFAGQLVGSHPYVREMARLNRAFLRHAVTVLVESGVRQFLDLGSGIPTVGNVHEVAHELDPSCRVVYVDYEPVAMAHTEILLEDNEYATAVQADATDTKSVLNAAETQRMLDFDKPIGVLAMTLFHYVSPEQAPFEVFARYREALASGSWMALTHLAATEETGRISTLMQSTANSVYPRQPEEISALFGDFALLDQGLRPVGEWLSKPEETVSEESDANRLLAGIARKP